MDSKDSAAISPAPEVTPSPAVPAEVVPSPGSSPTLSPEAIQENVGDDAGVEAASVEEGFETASEPEDDEDEPSVFGGGSFDPKDLILPPEEDVAASGADLAPGGVGEEEVPGEVVVFSDVAEGENPSVTYIGETLALDGDEGVAGDAKKAATALVPGGVEEEEVPGEVMVSSNGVEGGNPSVADKGETLAVDGHEVVTGDAKQNPNIEENSKLGAWNSAPLDSEVEEMKTAAAVAEVMGKVDDELIVVVEEKKDSVDNGNSDGNVDGEKESEATGADSNDVPNVVEVAAIPDSSESVHNPEVETSVAIKAEDVEAGAEGYGNDEVLQLGHKDVEPQVETEIDASFDLNCSTDVGGRDAIAAKAKGGETSEKLQPEVPPDCFISEGYANGDVLEVGCENGELQVYENGNTVLADETNVVRDEDGGSAGDVDADVEPAKGKTGNEVSGNDEHQLDVASKGVEPEVSEGSADAFASKEGSMEGDAGVQEIIEDGLEVETSEIPVEQFDALNGTDVNDKSSEEDEINEKMVLELQKVNAESEVNASEANKAVDLPVVAEGEINSIEIDSQVPKISGIKENGSLEPASAAEDEYTASGTQLAVNDDEKMAPGMAEEEEEEEEDDDDNDDDGVLVSDSPTTMTISESSETARQMIQDMEEDSEEVDTDEEEDDGKEVFDSAALAALLKAATGSSPDGTGTLSSQDASRIFSVDRPAGLGSSVPSLRPASARTTRPTLFTPSELAVVSEEENMNEEERKLHEKVEQIRVKFLRLVQRLNHSPEDTVAAQVLYRLGLAEGIKRGRQNSRMFNLENAKKKALQLEADGKNDLDFSCNILVIGKTGVGKSATINSIFGEEKTHINAYEPATRTVKVISGVVDGVKIQVIDTPGLRTSAMEQSANRKILSSIKKFTKKCPPDIVLYVDRLDSQTRDLNDLPLLRSVTGTLASSIWFNAIVALTHAASAPPDGPNGSPMSYEMFTAQRSHVVQHSIRQAAGDMRLMNPVALVENHPSCRRNREGERVLPNGQSWRSQMLLLCYSSKILSEANSLLKLQDSSPGKLFGFRLRSPPLPFLLSSLLQSRAHPKLSPDQGGDNGDSDMELDDLSDADDDEEGDEYDQLPPFKPLRKAQIAKLTKEQRRAYFEEYDYRVKLLQKKQWKEELKRMKEMKKRGKSNQEDLGYGDMAEDYDQEDAVPASVPVPLPDMVLPPSFDCENPVYRYRFLEPTSQLLTRPVLDTHGWDHDCGYDGVSIEQALALAGRFPVAAAAQITKDKKDFSIHFDSSIAAKHGENGSTLACFDVQPIGRQLGYTLRGETKFKSFKKNKTTGGISVTFLGETVATGMKVEDQLSIGKRVTFVASTGAVRAQGDTAYGANLEARLRDKDFPVGQALATLGLSLMKWHGDLALGANLQSQFPVGRSSKVAVRVGLNNKLSGQITVKSSTSEQLQIALVGIIPIALSVIRNIWPSES